jgi:predicted RNA binding protein YcfA (HicA-like mRNA interferase family)/predicted RNase H-like HicB family nuclease
VKVRDVLKLLEREGWRLVATRGSHRQFKHGVRPGRVTVAGHPSDNIAPRHLEQHSKTSRLEVKYFVIYEKTATGFSAYAPDLPGCVATGSTMDEIKTTMREAIEFHLEGLHEDGRQFRSQLRWPPRKLLFLPDHLTG